MHWCALEHYQREGFEQEKSFSTVSFTDSVVPSKCQTAYIKDPLSDFYQFVIRNKAQENDDI